MRGRASGDLARVAAIAFGVSVGVLAGSILGGAGASATNFGGPKGAGACDDEVTSECVANNVNHSVNYHSTLNTTLAAAMDYAAEYYDDNTDMNVTWDVLYTVANDVRVSNANYGHANGNHAWTRCSSTPTATGDNGTSADGEDLKWCYPQLIQYNHHYPHDADEKRAIMCHELGHTMGLRHNGTHSTSCMKNPPWSGGLADELHIHDITKLNEEY